MFGRQFRHLLGKALSLEHIREIIDEFLLLNFVLLESLLFRNLHILNIITDSLHNRSFNIQKLGQLLH